MTNLEYITNAEEGLDFNQRDIMQYGIVGRITVLLPFDQFKKIVDEERAYVERFRGNPLEDLTSVNKD